jgi:hypothetical protein
MRSSDRSSNDEWSSERRCIDHRRRRCVNRSWETLTVFLYFGSTVGHIKHGKFAYKDKQDVVRLSRVSAIRSHCVSSSISIAYFRGLHTFHRAVDNFHMPRRRVGRSPRDDAGHPAPLSAETRFACNSAVEHQAALLLGCLGRHEPHVCPGDRLADGLSVSSIILVSLDVGFHERDQ